jgi:cobalamin-dependent methionine synthase I
VSDVSFGLPVRKLLNETFLILLMAHGLDAAIVDSCDQQPMMNVAQQKRCSDGSIARATFERTAMGSSGRSHSKNRPSRFCWALPSE